jgi:predicted metal-dependent hydrolase
MSFSSAGIAPASGRVLDFAMRNVHFDVADCDVRGWHPAGLHVCHFFNALSVRFPEGEKFFINSVRHYRDQIHDPALLADIEAFIGQEAMHGREHRGFNAALERAGYGADQMEQELKTQIKRLKMPPLFQLSVTCAAEHFTAIMSSAVLADDRILQGVEPEMAAMWRWHALEETEHKAVAYDVFMAMRKGPVSGYCLRCTMMLLTSLSFWFNALRNLVRMVRQDGALGDMRGWRKLGRFLFVSPGLMGKMLLPYLAYFKPGFHPWQAREPAGVERVRQAANDRLAAQQGQ